MYLKKSAILMTALSIGVFTSFSVLAYEKITPQYDVETFGSATAIPPDDYLLDGNYENGELVNGGIYFSESEALAGMERDRQDALFTKLYPGTGIVEGD